MEHKEPKIGNTEPVQTVSREEIEHLPRVETYEEFCHENVLLENFVDQLEKNAPYGEIDIYSREFWDYYQKYIEQVWQEKYLPIVNGTYEKHEQPVMDYVFSGNANCFRSNEHLARMKQKTALNMVQEELGFDNNTIELIKRGQSPYYRLDCGYGPKNVSDKVLETEWEEMKEARDMLIKHPNFEKLSALNERMKLFNDVYRDVGGMFMYGNFSSAKQITKQYNNSYDTAMYRELADSLSEEYSIQNSKNVFLSQEDRDLFSGHPEMLKKIVRGACEQAFIYNSSSIVSKVMGDANGYSSSYLFLNPETEKGKERLLYSNKL